MREIKFRVWDKFLKKIRPVHFLSFPLGGDSCKEVSCMCEDEKDLCEWVFDYEIMQYTGLKDKYNVEIYEGDVLKEIQDHGFDPIRIGDGVKFNTQCNWYEFAYGRPIDPLYEYEVVGNIYENPELLEDAN